MTSRWWIKRFHRRRASGVRVKRGAGHTSLSKAIVVSNIWKHLHKHDIILHFQHGFQSGLSFESQLIETVHDWMMALDNKTQIDAILLDFVKAFDKVPHKRLLSKLTSYGITGNTHNWITSFYQIVSSESWLMEPCRTSQIYIWCPTGLSSGTYTLLAVHQRHQRHQRKRSIEYPPICR